MGAQSFWYDETDTVRVIDGSLGHVFSAVKNEASPHLYYLLAWLWSKPFGHGEGALRSLSVIAGVATVPLAWAIGRRLVSPPAGLLAGALVAANPMLVWYSQEARNYALLAMLGALSIWLCLRAIERPSGWRLAAWSASSCLALLCHYFAAFAVVPEAGLLAWGLRERLRPLVYAGVPVALVALALIPFAHEQSGNGAWIDAIPLAHRIGDVARELGTANLGLISASTHRPPGSWTLPAAALVAASLIMLAISGDRRAWRGAAIAFGLGAFAVLVPLLLSFTSPDFFFDRNLIIAWVPLLIVIAAGPAAVRALPVGLAVALPVCALGVAVDLKVASDRVWQREDWRDLAAQMGPPDQTRAVLVEPAYAVAPLQVYGHEVEPMPAGTQVREIVLIGRLGVARGGPPAAPPGFQGGFHVVRRFDAKGMQLLVYRARRPAVFTSARIGASAATASVLLERG